MAQKQLNAVVVIGGRTDSSFNQIGDALISMGNAVDGVSQKLIDFGKESLQVYSDYEYNMRTVEEIWGSNGTFASGSRALKNAMKTLSDSASDWAANSIFHTDDVSNALVEAAHAGWNLDEMLNGVPSAMKLAQAGGMDLSTSLDYVLKSMKSLGMEYSYLDTWVDEWVYASNKSAGTAEEFGDTFLRMGSTMRYAADPEEILALTAIMHNMGATGSEAGTMVRNSMLRLLAPSGVASKVLEQLGATKEEIAEIREDSNKAGALFMLEEHGFSAFDENGQAKSIIEIYSSLGEALADIAGGYENISKNETALGILSNVFGARAQTGAMNLVARLEEASQLYGELSGGAANGAAGKMAVGMMDTYFGDVETFKSKVEELKRAVGEELAPQARGFLNSLGNMVDGVTNMDDRKFTALVGGLKGIAVLGGGLTTAGIAVKTLGTLMTPGGRFALAATATTVVVTALVGALNDLNEIDYKDNFGSMELNEDDILSYAEQLNNQYASLYSNVEGFKTALEGSVDAYETASATYKSSLIEDMLKGVDLREDTEEYVRLFNLGKDVIGAINDGIETAYGANTASVDSLFSQEEKIDNPLYDSIMSALEAGYSNAKDRATILGNDLRKALVDAMTNDGILDADELAKIQSIMDELNQVMAEQAAAENYVKQQELLRKAQTLGLESTQDMVSNLKAANDENIELLQQDFDRTYYAAKRGFDAQIANGEITEEEAAANLAELKSQQEKAVYERTADNEKLLLNTMDALLSGSDLYDAWTAARTLGESYRAAGGVVTKSAADAYNQSVSANDAADFKRYLQSWIDIIGYDNLQGYADAFLEKGDEAAASRFQNLKDIWDALGNGADYYATAGTVGEETYSMPSGQEGIRDSLIGLLNGLYGEGNGEEQLQILADHIAQEREEYGWEPNWQEWFGTDSDEFRAMQKAAENAGLSITEMVERAVGGIPGIDDFSREREADGTRNRIARLREEIADIEENGYWTRYGGNLWGQQSDEQAQAKVQRLQADIEINQDALAALYSENGIEIPVTPYIEGTDAVEALRDQGVQVDVEGDAAELQATIEAEDGQTLLQYVSGDASDLHMTIWDENGQTLVENVTGNTSELSRIINSYNGQTITLNLRGRQMFASGGRATEPSIFGEGNTAEWAIPEEHTPNTARLLMRAAHASGFGITLAEMPATATSSKGGAADDGGETMVQINYSPVIHAENAEGVDQVLKNDKRRFEQMLEERELYQSVVSYK